MKATLMALAFSLLTPVSMAERLPFNPEPVASLQADDVPPRGLTRLKLSVSNGDPGPAVQVDIGAITVCSRTACYRPDAKRTALVQNTSEGKAELVADMAIPFIEIESLFFDAASGSNAVAGHVKLSSPFKLQEPFHGGRFLSYSSEPKESTLLSNPVRRLLPYGDRR